MATGTTTIDRIVTLIEVEMKKSFKEMDRFYGALDKADATVKKEQMAREKQLLKQQQISFKNRVAYIKAQRRLEKDMIREINAAFKTAEQAKRKAQQQQIQAMQTLKAGMMSFGLSALFTGMAIKKLGDTILRSLVTTYMRATDEQNIFHTKLLGVQAAFEFLKFSIFDALSQSELVINMIDGFIELVNWLSAFVNKHPLVSKIFVAFALGAIVLGGVLMVIGQTTLGLLGIIGLFDILSVAPMGLGKRVIWIGQNIKNFLIPAMQGFKIIAINALKLIGKELMFIVKSPAILILTGIVLITTAIWNMQKAFGGFGNFFRMVGSGILKVLVSIGNFIAEKIINKIKTLLSIASKVAGLVGFEELQKKFDAAKEFVVTAEVAKDRFVRDLLAGIDQKFGADQIREKNPEVENFMKLVTGQTRSSITEPKIEQVNNIEIKFEGETGTDFDEEAFKEKYKVAIGEVNQEWFEEQITRLGGAPRGTE